MSAKGSLGRPFCSLSSRIRLLTSMENRKYAELGFFGFSGCISRHFAISESKRRRSSFSIARYFAFFALGSDSHFSSRRTAVADRALFFVLVLALSSSSSSFPPRSASPPLPLAYTAAAAPSGSRPPLLLVAVLSSGAGAAARALACCCSFFFRTRRCSRTKNIRALLARLGLPWLSRLRLARSRSRFALSCAAFRRFQSL
mmetsp:Transcript_5588/g.13619  ORF Transcript_5588/g.13619 Transcript_5588/m.13619 type:complete len:201 (+) Transcript_5588:228-830(+)